MPLTYSTGEEIKKGNVVLFHDEPGEIDFVADPLIKHPDTDYVEKFGVGAMVLEPKFSAALSSPQQNPTRTWCSSPAPRTNRSLHTIPSYLISGKSSSQYSPTLRPSTFRASISTARNSTLRIFPEIVFGNSANSILRTLLYGPSRPRINTKISRAVSTLASTPGFNTRNAFGTLHRSASGLGTTAASATHPHSMSALSSSNGLIR